MVSSPDSRGRKKEDSFKPEIENLNGFLKPDQKDAIFPLPVLQASDLMNRERMSVPSTKNSELSRLDEEFHKKDEILRTGQEHSAKDGPLDHGISRSHEEFHRKDEILRDDQEVLTGSGKDGAKEDDTEETLVLGVENGEENGDAEKSSSDNHVDGLPKVNSESKSSQNDAADNEGNKPSSNSGEASEDVSVKNSPGTKKVDKEVNEEVSYNGCLDKCLSLKGCVEDTNNNKWNDRVVPEETLQRRTSCDYEDGDLAPLPFSGALIPGVPYSGPIPYSGSISRRSDGSSASTRSFAFPVLPFEWNASPVRMPPPDKRFWHKKRNWRCLSCMCCTRPSTHP